MCVYVGLVEEIYVFVVGGVYDVFDYFGGVLVDVVGFLVVEGDFVDF